MFEKAQQIVNHAVYQGKERDFIGCPYGMAAELTDLIEWMADSPDDHRHIASIICKQYSFPQGAVKLIKQYFGLAY